MKAYLYLPHTPSTVGAVGGEFYFCAEFKRHLYMGRTFDLSDEVECKKFNELCKRFIQKTSIYQFIPLPHFVFEQLEHKASDVGIPQIPPVEPRADLNAGIGALASDDNAPNDEANEQLVESIEASNQLAEPSVNQLPLPSKNGRQVVEVLGGYALKRMDSRSKTGVLYRGISDGWRNTNAIPDPFPTIDVAAENL